MSRKIIGMSMKGMASHKDAQGAWSGSLPTGWRPPPPNKRQRAPERGRSGKRPTARNTRRQHEEDGQTLEPEQVQLARVPQSLLGQRVFECLTDRLAWLRHGGHEEGECMPCAPWVTRMPRMERR